MAEAPNPLTDSANRGAGRAVSADALFGLIGDDETIKARIRLLVNMILENSFNVMLHGTTADRVNMSRSLMPAIIKMLSGDGSGGVDSLRAEMMKMFREMGGGEAALDVQPDSPPPPPPAL